jgi:hypothetical protein
MLPPLNRDRHHSRTRKEGLPRKNILSDPFDLQKRFCFYLTACFVININTKKGGWRRRRLAGSDPACVNRTGRTPPWPSQLWSQLHFHTFIYIFSFGSHNYMPDSYSRFCMHGRISNASLWSRPVRVDSFFSQFFFKSKW